MKTKKSIFETVYEIHANMVYRLAFSYLKHKEDAEDVVQEVFTKYVCGLRLPMSPEHEKAWFVRVTINQCHDVLRRRKYRIHEDLDTVVEKALEADDSISNLLDALQQLPEKNRSVVILHYLEGYSVEEVGKLLGLSVSAVKMRLKRSRESLREELEKES